MISVIFDFVSLIENILGDSKYFVIMDAFFEKIRSL